MPKPHADNANARARRLPQDFSAWHELVEKWPEPMLLLDAESFVDANPAAVRMLGFADKQELLRRRPEDISPPRQPDGEISAAKARSLLERSLAGETLRFEWTHIRIDGGEIHVDVTLSPIAGPQGPLVLCAWHDIGELRRSQTAALESERRFRSLFEKNTSVMLLVDPESGLIVDANAAAAAYYAYPAAALIGMPITRINTLAPELVAEQQQRALREECNYFNFPHRLANGDIREVEVYSTPIPVGKKLLLFSIIHDISERRQIESKLRDREARYRSVVENVSEVIFQTDAQGRWTFLNPAWTAITGFPVEASLGSAFSDYVHPEDRRISLEQFRALLAGEQDNFRQEIRCLHRDGGLRWIELYAGRLVDAAGRLAGSAGTLADITARKDADRKLRLAAGVFTHAREGILITTVDGTIVDVNSAFEQVTGFARDEVIGRNPRMLSSGRNDPALYADMWRSLEKAGHWQGEVWNRRKNGETYPEMLAISAVRDASGRTVNYIALFSDITAQKEHELQLERLAHYDALTGLPNRLLLADRLHQAMALVDRRGTYLAVVYLDIDGFKGINDRFGHDFGDQLLISVADHIRQAVREGDTTARLGGDEFVAVLIDLPKAESSVPLLKRLLAAAAKPSNIGDVALKITASLGVAFYPQADEIDADQLMRQADQAMYQAKLAGKNRYHVFDPEQDRSLKGRHETLESIQRALGDDQFTLHYQPIVNLRTGEVIAAEALIRWRHPEQGLILPGGFLPVIEDHPLLVELGDWVIAAALKQIQEWRAGGLDLAVSVNIGARQLQQSDFVDRLREQLARHPDVAPGRLKLEVLETSALDDIEKASRVIAACNEIGVPFALDDFGTGYSSLTYLKRLPATFLKIDQSFVHDMLDDPDDLAILEGVLGLASAFRRQVIAEGVESSRHAEMLLRLGCELAQGFGIARPMPGERLPAWIRSWSPPASWATLSPLPREKFPLLFAGVEHRAWMRAVEAFLRGESSLLPPLDPRQCRFGQWLYGKAEGGRLARPGYDTVESLHRDIHAMAAELADLHSRGAGAQEEKLLLQLQQTSENLIGELNSLQQPAPGA